MTVRKTINLNISFNWNNCLFNFAFWTVLFLNEIFFSCSSKKKIDFDRIIVKYSARPSDSLKLACALFLKENGLDQLSEYPVFFNAQRKNPIDIKLDTFTSEGSLKETLTCLDLDFKITRAPDSLLLTTELVEKQIERSVVLYNKYAWNQHIPKDVFLNFLLPYKIYGEVPADWSTYLSRHYDSIVCLRNNKIAKYRQNDTLRDPDELYYDILVNNIAELFKYDTNFFRLSDYPSFYELLSSKKGDCIRSSYMNTYILRSQGLPATVDIVPFWGSKNGSHASEVYWNNKKRKFVTGPGRQFDRPAKVFRFSFKKENLWTDSIKPFVSEASFYLNNLKHDHWLDVTDQHTITSDITINLGSNVNNISFAYICVFNYGDWQPIYWGPIKSNGDIKFKKMGANVLYRVAFPTPDGLQYLKPLFAMDSTGRLRFFKPFKCETQTMLLSKLNTGNAMWVKKGIEYSLMYLDSANEWRKHGNTICLKDSSISFKGVPSNTLYRMIKTTGDRRLERMFTYEHNKQSWW